MVVRPRIPYLGGNGSFSTLQNDSFSDGHFLPQRMTSNYSIEDGSDRCVPELSDPEEGSGGANFPENCTVYYKPLKYYTWRQIRYVETLTVTETAIYVVGANGKSSLKPNTTITAHGPRGSSSRPKNNATQVTVATGITGETVTMLVSTWNSRI